VTTGSTAAEPNPIIRKNAELWLVLGYVVLYAVGYLCKPVSASAAIWPSDALAFAAFMLLPVRRWAWIAIVMIAAEFTMVPILNSISHHHQRAWLATLGFALANVLTTAGPAALSSLLHLFHRQDRWQLAISPVWIIALFVGVLPGSILGVVTRAYVSDGMPQVPADVGLWGVASVLTIVTFGPTVFGLLLGFSEPAHSSARPWEGWLLSFITLALIAWFAFVPWPGVDQLVQPMLFTLPLAWLALRFSRRTTSVAVAIVAVGVVLLTEHAASSHVTSGNIEGWRDVVISIDIFLLIGGGGALLINLLTLRQRALLEELAREHAQLRKYAEALDFAEETARRSTAADLHDGIGQVLAGQSMTLAAMRAHARHPMLAALVDEAVEASREAQAGLRLMIQDLSPPELEHASLDEMLKWIAELFNTRFGFNVTWRVIGSADLGRKQLQLVYRCIRELVMNACKHSQRQSVEVEVDVSSASVDITVIDEGVGFDTRRQVSLSGRRFGLAQLRQRVSTAGGAIDIDAVVGEGCRVTVRLPSSSPVSG
jgi:signal transduction histidine kinase